MNARPNFLLITSDQHRWDALGVYRDQIKTPNLDCLAREGIVFDRAYTASPVCTPARVSMLTGHYPSRHGCYTIGTELPADYPTIPGLLSEQGYFTALLGKGHFSPCLAEGGLEASPRVFDEDFFSNWTGPWYGFDYVQLCIGHSNESLSAGMHYGAWLKERGIDRHRYFGTGNYEDHGAWDLPEEAHNSKWTVDVTIDAMERAAAGGQPFFLWSSFQDPHNPCVVPEPWASMYHPNDMPIYQSNADDSAGKPPFYSSEFDEQEFKCDDRLGPLAWQFFRTSDSLDIDSEQEKREIMAKYFGMVSLMDHHIGRILDYLEETGQRENTVIVFTSDHGEYLGDHDLWWKGLPAYESAQRVPMIVSHPDCQTPGTHSSALQNTLDIGSSFLAQASLEIPDLMQGVEQGAAWRHCDAKIRDWAMVEFRPTEDSFMQKTLLFDHYKMVTYSKPEWGEIYDLEADPTQDNNLWDSDAHAALKLKLYGEMVRAEMEKDGRLRTRKARA